MTMVDIPLTEAERMQARAHAYNLTVFRWALGGAITLSLVIGACSSSAAVGRAEKAEAALREYQRQHAPSRVESAARWLTSPKGGK